MDDYKGLLCLLRLQASLYRQESSVVSCWLQGPCYARYVASTLYQGEDFYLQLDSHMRFGEGWDQALIDMVLSSSDQRAVFSHYPHDMAQMSSTAPRTNDVPRMCDAYFDEATGFPFFKTVQQHMQPGDHRPAAFTAAGMLFARWDAVQ